jgi:pimeloyl-ACP methyl ester carboxylesterase
MRRTVASLPVLETPTDVPSSDGVRVAVHDLGGSLAPGAPVLVFSHATGFHAQVWAPMAGHLLADHRCLAVDYRGHGVADTPEGLTFEWRGFADDAEAVLTSDLLRDVAGAGPVHGVGHSMGGAALVMAAARRPDAVASLWLYEPILPGPDSLMSKDGPNPLAEGAARRRPTFDSYEAARRHFAGKAPLDQLHPAALRAYVEGGFAPRDDGTVTLRCRPADESATFSMAGTSGAWGLLPTVAVPVAVVVGREEAFGPAAFGPPAAEALPHGLLVERRHLGHFGPLEDPAGMAADLAAWVAAH